MAEANNGELVKTTDPRIIARASEIRQQLLQFRFDCFRSVRPAIIPTAEGLRPRSRDLLASLGASLEGAPEERGSLLTFFKSCHDPRTREPLDSPQDALVAVILEICHAYPDLFSVRVGGDQDSLAKNTNNSCAITGNGPSSATKQSAACSTLWGFTARTELEKTGFSG